MNFPFDINQSLEQLENDFWKEPETFPTGLVENCFRFRKIPLKSLSTEQLRLLIGQKIGLDYLVPIAIERLKKDILTEGNFYPGDLLNSVISSGTSFWKKNKILWKEMVYLLEVNKQRLINEISTRQTHRDIDAFKQMLQP